MSKTVSILAAVLAGAAVMTAPAMASPAGVKVGTLTCHVASGWGFIFGSSKDLHCNFSNGRHFERYAGSISKFGVDIGYTEGGELIWTVFAPESDIHPGALEGSYAGATASATVAVGLGANVLVGGLDRSIALQPLSVEGNSGLNVAAGIGSINLKYVPREESREESREERRD
ncbi:MAG: DUF992 domain-containing protein [Alphaproteobacteria bacterium]|nr:DUF992 domain-containing protein [Alphaproteobacteria bacterium]MBV9692138.1 DUF992 domain-containing protein [Alphaproteobacteria bacterium]